MFYNPCSSKEFLGDSMESATGSAYPSATAYSDGTELKCEYSRSGRKLSEDDGAVRWEYAYNQGGWCTMERDGEGNETHYLYDGMGRKLAMYTPMQWEKRDGKRTDYQYDFLERLIDTAYPDGSHEKLFRDGEGNILKKVHPNAYDERTKDGEGTSYDYDGENRLLRIHYPDGGVERFFYDAAGNRIKHVLPEQYDEAADDEEGWTYAYDEGNRLVSVTGPDGVVENTYAYDLWGNCVRKTDEKGCSTYYAYDLMGRLIRELAPVGEDTEKVCCRKTSYEYDGSGNRIREIWHGGSFGAEGQLITEGEDLVLSFAYDARNRLVCVEDGLGARVSYRYDAREPYSQSPMFGEDWNRYFNETYGQDIVMWESASLQDIIDMPSKVTNFSPQQLINLARANGWSVKPLGRGSLAGVPYEQGGGFRINAPNGGSKYIQYHPGGGHHGDLPYFKVSSAPNGILRFFIGGIY